jgi:hypothetical protein
MGALEKFLHDDPVKSPTLIKAGLAHVQFETIHPFLDGNGRLGRLLITLLLCAEGALSEPILYLSLYFKTRRLEYHERLQRVRTHGDWEGWMGEVDGKAAVPAVDPREVTGPAVVRGSRTLSRNLSRTGSLRAAGSVEPVRRRTDPPRLSRVEPPGCSAHPVSLWLAP